LRLRFDPDPNPGRARHLRDLRTRAYCFYSIVVIETDQVINTHLGVRHLTRREKSYPKIFDLVGGRLLVLFLQKQEGQEELTS
jgi:hypothetical protein